MMKLMLSVMSNVPRSANDVALERRRQGTEELTVEAVRALTGAAAAVAAVRCGAGLQRR